MKTILALFLGLFLISCKSGSSSNNHMDFPVSVIVAEAKTEEVAETIKIVGSLIADEQIEIRSKVEGTLEKIAAQEGQVVNTDELLFKIDEARYRAILFQAQANFQLADQNFKRSETLIKQNSISRQEYDQARSNYNATKGALELSQQQLADAIISSPFAGILGSRQASVGQMVSKGELISYLTKINPLKIEFSVPENYAASLGLEMEIGLKVSAYPEEKFQGKVYFVAPLVEEKTRTILVKGMVNNNQAKLKAGMFAEIELKLRTLPGLFIPESALVIKGKEKFVFIVGPDGNAEMKSVEIARRIIGKLEITSGLAPGTKVITEGTQKLRPGAKLLLNNQP